MASETDESYRNKTAKRNTWRIKKKKGNHRRENNIRGRTENSCSWVTALGLDRDHIISQCKGRKGRKDSSWMRVIYYQTNNSWGKQEEGCTSAVLRCPSWNEKVTNNLHLQALWGRKAEICVLGWVDKGEHQQFIRSKDKKHFWILKLNRCQDLTPARMGREIWGREK